MSDIILNWGFFLFIFSTLFGLGVGIMSMSPPEFAFAKLCFSISALIAAARLGWWLAVEQPLITDDVKVALAAFALFGCIGVLWIETLRWIENRQKIFLPPQSHNLRALVIEDTFQTLVPFNTGPGLPIPDFLNDFMGRSLRDMNDPIHRYPRLAELAKDAVITGATYDSLQQLQQLLDAKKPVSDEGRRKLLAEVLQYYIIERIDVYQFDYNAAIAILGRGKGVSHRRGNHPPDLTQYPTEDFLAAISANSLSQFAFINRFRFSPRGYWVPTGTKITLENTMPAPTKLRYVFTLHNPNVYLLSVAVEESSFGALTGLPSHYQTTADINPDLVLCYYFIVKCHFEYYRRTDTDNLEQEQYTHWAESLFSSLKEHLADG